MNTKGQIGIGVIIMTAVAIIVGLVLLTGSIAPSIAQMNTLGTVTNQTINFTTGTIALAGKVVTGLTITNTTGFEDIPASNYTLTNSVVQTDGTLKANLQKKAGAYANKNVNISYTYQPDGYADDAASRSIISIIVVLCAMAILVVAVSPILRDNLLGMLGK